MADLTQIEWDEWRTYILDSNRNRIALLSNFTRYNLVKRFNGVGSFWIDGSATDRALTRLTQAGGIEVRYKGELVFTGPVRRFNATHDGKQAKLTVTGHDDMRHLWGRIVYPDPAHTPGAWTTSHDVRTGVTETVIKQYVDYNAGPNALPERRVPGLTIQATTGLGTSRTWRGRCDNLIKFLQEIAIADGLGFDIDDRVFKVYQPQDRRKLVTFSLGQGSISEYDYIYEASEGNACIAGGEGEGAARLFVEAVNVSSVTNNGIRLEYFYDYRRETVSANLAAAAIASLATNDDQISLSVTPKEVPHRKFKIDYYLGDLVSAYVASTVISAVIKEIHINLNPDRGLTIIPFLETGGSSLRNIFAPEEAMRRRLSNIEGV